LDGISATRHSFPGTFRQSRLLARLCRRKLHLPQRCGKTPATKRKNRDRQSDLLPAQDQESQIFQTHLPLNHPPYKVLILCTGNSARSVIAEYLLRKKGKGRFETYSAGSHPTGRVNSLALWVLKEHYNVDASDARSKSWDEFKGIKFDFIITVCDNARESCPVFPGHPVTAHFGSPDPAGYEGTEEKRKWFFLQVAGQIACRLDLFCALPDAQLDPMRVRAIGGQHKLETERQATS